MTEFEYDRFATYDSDAKDFIGAYIKVGDSYWEITSVQVAKDNLNLWAVNANDSLSFETHVVRLSQRAPDPNAIDLYRKTKLPDWHSAQVIRGRLADGEKTYLIKHPGEDAFRSSYQKWTTAAIQAALIDIEVIIP